MLPVPFRKSCISNLLLSYFRQKRTDDNQPVWLICLHFRVSSCVFFFLLQLLPAIASWCFLLIKCDVRYLEEWNTDQNPGRVQILNRSLKKKKVTVQCFGNWEFRGSGGKDSSQKGPTEPNACCYCSVVSCSYPVFLQAVNSLKYSLHFLG